MENCKLITRDNKSIAVWPEFRTELGGSKIKQFF